MSLEHVKKVCEAWISEGMGSENFWESWSEEPTGDTLCANDVYMAIKELEDHLNALTDDVKEAEAYADKLDKACAKWAEVSQTNYQRAKAAEAKLSDSEALLAKVVDVLGYYALNNDGGSIARTTLAELKG